jgi:hypothetical protein
MIYSFFPNYFHSGETRFLPIFIDFDEILYLKRNSFKLDYRRKKSSGKRYSNSTPQDVLVDFPEPLW